MPKYNPWALARPVWKPETETFTDPRHPDASFTITVRPLDAPELMLGLERADDLISQWVTGKNGQPPNAFPLGGGTVKLSASLVRAAVLIEAQQQQPGGEPYTPDEFYDFNDLIGIAANASAAWSRLAPWAQSRLTELEEEPGNE